jgi:hypothetical protein
MSKIVPGQPAPERKRGLGRQLAESKEPCARPDCLQRISALRSLDDANQKIVLQLNLLEKELSGAISQIATTEKATTQLDEDNDKIGEQVDEIMQRNTLLEVEAEEGERQKRELQTKLNILKVEARALQREAEERIRLREEAERAAADVVIFSSFNPASQQKYASDINTVSNLQHWDPSQRVPTRYEDERERTRGASTAHSSAQKRHGRSPQPMQMGVSSPGRKVPSPVKQLSGKQRPQSSPGVSSFGSLGRGGGRRR